MAVDQFEFTNRVGVELWELLMKRSDEELGGLRPTEQLQVQIGTALIPMASVLRKAILAADNRESACESMLAITSKWLRTMLEPVVHPEKS